LKLFKLGTKQRLISSEAFRFAVNRNKQLDRSELVFHFYGEHAEVKEMAIRIRKSLVIDPDNDLWNDVDEGTCSHGRIERIKKPIIIELDGEVICATKAQARALYLALGEMLENPDRSLINMTSEDVIVHNNDPDPPRQINEMSMSPDEFDELIDKELSSRSSSPKGRDT
jgi:hypothetical protein